MKGIFERKEHFGLMARKIKGFIGYPPMFHTHCELLYVIKGSVKTVIDGKEKLLQAGELAFLFSYLTHSYEDAPDAEVIVLLFEPGNTLFTRTLLSKQPSIPFINGKAFAPILERIVVLEAEGKVKTATGYLNAVIGELLELLTLGESKAMESDVCVKVLAYCSEHFNREITVRSVAEALYISQSYVSKIFSDKLRYGFREYINALRIDQAKALLEQTERRIEDIMFECGFKNQSSFNRIFQARCGLSPREYRKSLSQRS